MAEDLTFQSRGGGYGGGGGGYGGGGDSYGGGSSYGTRFGTFVTYNNNML